MQPRLKIRKRQEKECLCYSLKTLKWLPEQDGSKKLMKEEIGFFHIIEVVIERNFLRAF